MHYQWDFSLVWDNLPVLLKGLGVTFELWLLAGVLGTVLGLVFGLFRVFGKRWLSLPARVFVEIFRNTPVLIQLIWFYYAFPVLVGIQFSTFAAAALALTLYSAAYCTEIFRAGLQSIDHGQWEGAKALGMQQAVILRRVVLPQVVRNMLPALTNRMIELAKVTSLASILAVNELMYQGRLLSSTYYRPLEILTVVALLYFILIWPGSYLAARLERRFRSTP
ncbi:amino acid ABC transporter permease [Pectobacterium aroidearum]|uniref:Amino acid ABC transporter permease n=1 Tax=Pectobacterium aroidearum TaxID=1201031 RepID=A0ABR5ZAX3_9GAMM|nr:MULTISPECIES: amino acid ABC transporter permease [Pectobacterium]MBA5198941.1 amino acid ABC transporter permease [Pectobacterium aroidearum]MBA5226589.1 amino acid ABC transporter permease [Pectobacterium aroidearum]MBA5231733.1 amino acid ABC transporter permease [Pectobacterium aroidearum]MBA5736888.1 amino acid ABC transporter permease [Pectobacterium aroidearum]UXJ98944.1 amino acid ABC transporter permease [Pectobacterium aroidearum]